MLKAGDMVLEVAGRPVSSYDDVERVIASYSPSSSAGAPSGSPSPGAGAAAAGAADGPASVNGEAEGPAAKRRRVAGGGELGRGAGGGGGASFGMLVSLLLPLLLLLPPPLLALVLGAVGRPNSFGSRAQESCFCPPQHYSQAGCGCIAVRRQTEPQSRWPLPRAGAADAEPAAAAAGGDGGGSGGAEGGGGGDGGDVVEVPLRIFRGGEVLELGVRLGLEDGLGTDRLVHWCGAQLQVGGAVGGW